MLNQRGVTLLETTVALVIFSLIVAGIWTIYSRVTFNQNVGRTERGIVETSVKIREFYKDRTLTAASGLNNAQAMNFDLIAPELLIGGTPVHHLGMEGAEALTVGADGATCGAADNLFFIRMDQLSKSGCNQIISRLAGNRGKLTDYNIASATINGIDVLSAANHTFDVKAAKRACADNSIAAVCFRTK